MSMGKEVTCSSSESSRAQPALASVRSVGLSRILALALVLQGVFVSCQYFTRGGLMKLQAYEPDRLAELDPNSVRFAFQHDARIHLDLRSTNILLRGGFHGRMRDLSRFEPDLLSEGDQRLPGLPAAEEGFGWTLVGIRKEDQQLARATVRLLARESSPGSAADREAVQKELLRLYPRIDLRVGEKGEMNLEWEFRFGFTSSPEVDKKKSPIKVWLLLDPKDGYFEIIKGPAERDD